MFVLEKLLVLEKLKTKILIELKGLIRFENIKEIESQNKYRTLGKFDDYQDLSNKKEELKFSDLELILKI